MNARKIAVIGVTGPHGRGLARWLAAAGHTVVLGSRSADRANAAAKEVRDRTGGNVSWADNWTAATVADVVLVVVPWDGYRELVKSLVGAGALRLASHLEPLTAVLIGINRRYKIRSGLAIAGAA